MNDLQCKQTVQPVRQRTDTSASHRDKAIPAPRVVILNPQGASSISRERANRYVKSGRARYVDPNHLRFITADSGHQAALSQMHYDREAKQGRLATLDQVKNLPVTAKPEKAYELATKVGHAPKRNGRTVVKVKNGIECLG